VTLIATGFDPEMNNLPQTNGMPTYIAPAPQMQQPAPVASWRQQPVAQPQPANTGAWNAWQQPQGAPVQEGSGSIRAQRPSGSMPVAAAAPRPGLRREPSGSQVAVAPLSANRARGIFVPDLDESMDDDIDKPAYLRQRG
jgi:hypothetical protein